MRLVLVSFTLLIYSCMSIIIETLHDQYFSLTSEDSLRDSKPRVRGPRDSHDVSVYETCARVIHTNLLSYMSFHINVCVGYMCFVKL